MWQREYCSLRAVFSFCHTVFKIIFLYKVESFIMKGSRLNEFTSNNKRYLYKILINRFMLFNAVFNVVSVISRRSLHLSMLSSSPINQYSTQYSFPSHCLLSHITIVEITNSSERGMNPVAMTIINPRKEY